MKAQAWKLKINYQAGWPKSEYGVNLFLFVSFKYIFKHHFKSDIFTDNVHPLDLCKGIWIPESEKFLLVESGTWAFESGIQLKESGIPMTIGIRNPSSSKDKESGIHGVESRIQDSLGFPYEETHRACTVSIAESSIQFLIILL